MKAHRFGGLELSICIVVIPYVWNIFSPLNIFREFRYSYNSSVCFDCRNAANSL